MAFTQAQLDALEEAISAGATSVSYEGKTVSYRTLDDMLRLRTIIRKALGLSPASATTLLVKHSRGGAPSRELE